MLNRAAFISLLPLLLVSACATQPKVSLQSPSPSPQTSDRAITITSSAFQEGQPIPRQYTCDGVNVSPALEWTGVPKTAKTIAIIADDPDAPSGTFTHWVLYNLPSETIGMVENLPATEDLKSGGHQGLNDFNQVGYGGPCPPSGRHRYFFKLFALDYELPLKAGAKRPEVDQAMEGHILGQGQLMGTYHR